MKLVVWCDICSCPDWSLMLYCYFFLMLFALRACLVFLFDGNHFFIWLFLFYFLKTLQNARQNTDNEEKDYGNDDIDMNGAAMDGDEVRRNWTLNKETGTVVFVRQEQVQQSIDAMETAKDMLEFTGHIETII